MKNKSNILFQISSYIQKISSTPPIFLNQLLASPKTFPKAFEKLFFEKKPSSSTKETQK